MFTFRDYRQISLWREYPELIKIAFVFRYVSLIITSLFYLLGDEGHSLSRKVVIVCSISASALILNYLYIKSEQSRKSTILLVLIETIGNSIILIPSGGLSSPYVWYSLNTILISAVKLNTKFCWLNLLIYLFNSTYIANFVNGNVNFFRVVIKESNLILSFILITGVILLLSKYAQENEIKSSNLKLANNQLLSANRKIKESMNHIMELYKSVELFTAQENSRGLIDLITDYCSRVIGTDTVIFKSLINGDNVILTNTKINNLEEKISMQLQNNYISVLNSDRPIQLIICDVKYIFTSVRNNYKCFGILGIDMESILKENDEEEVIEQLKLIANLSSIILEKFELQQITEDLLINAEQNRIADEIHDGTLQRLFGTSCGIYEITKRLRKSTINIEKDLDFIRKSINDIMKDLRETIYGLSWKKNGVNNFLVEIENFLSDMKKLNNINIEFNLSGSDEVLSLKQKKAIYRIICEGTSNAIRHGKARDIYITLSLEKDYIVLEIVDNGVGFNINELEIENKMGLGIKNIRSLVHSLRGDIHFNSSVGRGTILEITVSNNGEQLLKEEVV